MAARRSPLAVNRCALCGRFKPWDELKLHFTPDTAFSSEDESYYECWDCANDPDGSLRGLD